MTEFRAAKGDMLVNTHDGKHCRVDQLTPSGARALVTPVKYTENHGIVRAGHSWWTDLDTRYWDIDVTSDPQPTQWTDPKGLAWERDPQVAVWKRSTERRELVIRFHEFGQFPYELDINASGFTIETDTFETLDAAAIMAAIVAK